MGFSGMQLQDGDGIGLVETSDYLDWFGMHLAL